MDCVSIVCTDQYHWQPKDFRAYKVCAKVTFYEFSAVVCKT